MPDIIGAAGYYQARGLCVFPVNKKIPVTDHGVHDASVDLDAILTQTKRRPDKTIKSVRSLTLTDWLNETQGIAIAVPPGFVVVDIDPRNGGSDTLDEWLTNADEEMRSAFELAPCVQTAGGGWHYWFRHDGVLFKTIGGVDFQRDGKYVVAPPSPGYTWLTRFPDDLGEIPTLPRQLAQIATPKTVAAPVRDHLGGRPGGSDELDDAAHGYTTWNRLLTLHGWTEVSADKWRHPASENQFSATITNDCLFVYSPNTPFEVTSDSDPHGYTLFRAICVLDYNNDASYAVRAFRDRGLLPYVPTALDLDRRMSAATRQKPDRSAPRSDEHANDSSDDGGHAPKLALVDMENVRLRRVRWLWKNRIPTGALTLLAGREGEGKSTIAIDSMARVTRGRSKGEFEGTPRDTIIVATEDSYEHTIAPRLIAAGADLKRVFRVNMLGEADSLILPVDLAELERKMSERDVALIVLDPLLSRLDGRLDSHKDSDVRRALEPLGAFADRTGVAILGLIHLNKGGSTDPLQAVMASRAFTAFARAVLFAMVDPDNDNRRLLGLVKSNLGPLDLPTLTYTFEPIVVGDDDGPIVATRVLWGPDSETNIRDALTTASVDPTKVLDAGEWLKRYLDEHQGRASVTEIQTAMPKNLGSWSTMKNARKRAGIVSSKEGFGGGYFWHYPDGKTHSEDDES